jgi:arsenite methyltransferase
MTQRPGNLPGRFRFHDARILLDSLHSTGGLMATTEQRIDYGLDAPVAIRNLALIGVVLLLVAFLGPRHIPIGTDGYFDLHKTCLITGAVLVVEAILMLLYSRFGKFKHRDFMLAMNTWRGDEQVLDVGCGRGLLLAGAAKHLTSGHATGIDIWSNVDLSNNSEAATLHNLELEGVTDRCTLLSTPAQTMPFPAETFDVIVSNLCLHNISSAQERLAAIQRIAYVLKPGGNAYLSDFKKTREYAKHLRSLGFEVGRVRGSFLATFPPLTVVIAHKPE